MLTKQQKKLFDFISEKNEKEGVCPSYQEMKDHMGIASKSGIFRIVDVLCEKGLLRKNKYMARSLVVCTPDTDTGLHRDILEASERVHSGEITKGEFYVFAVSSAMKRLRQIEEDA